MLPFARMLEYGNFSSKKVKNLSNDLDLLVLWEDGTLWGSGYNRYGQTSTSSSNTSVLKNWNLMYTGVEDIVSAYNSGYLIKMKNGNYYTAGDISWTGSGTSATLVDVTSRVSNAGSILMRDVVTTSGVVFGISTDNVLYGFSPYNTRGVLGDGTVSPSTSYKLLLENVSKIFTNGNNSFAIKTDGTLWGTGWNNGSSLGINGSSQVNTWTQIMPGVFSDVRDVSCANNGTWVLNGDGRVYSVGSQANGTGSTSTTFVIISSLVSASIGDNYSLGTSSSTFNTFCFLNGSTNGQLYFSGNFQYTGTGTSNDEKGLWTTNWASGLMDMSTVRGYFGYESNVWFDGKKMIFSGQQRYIPGYPSTALNVQFQEIQLPIGTEF